MQGASVTSIGDWLERLGLEKYASVFAEHDITLEALPHLTEPDIDRLALPTGPRRRLVVAVQALAAATRARPSVQSPRSLLEQPSISPDAARPTPVRNEKR
jgi:hypothetical protein